MTNRAALPLLANAVDALAAAERELKRARAEATRRLALAVVDTMRTKEWSMRDFAKAHNVSAPHVCDITHERRYSGRVARRLLKTTP